MYVDAIYELKESVVKVVERKNGKRVFKDIPADYTYYVLDPKGSYKTIYGDTVKKMVCKNSSDFAKAKKIHSQSKTFEMDVQPVSRCLENEYSKGDVPDIHVAFFDIETDFDQELGYSSPQEAFNPITSIAVYLQWLGQMVCLAVPPRKMSKEDAEAIAAEVGDTIICENEAEMLTIFLQLIEDADLLSGWNSVLYDIPYTVNRIEKILGKHEVRKMCLWDRKPKPKVVERFGKENATYELVGRIHLDYLDLYKKYTYEERHSYSLDAIAEHELNDKKVPYDGTLDQLYNEDFKKFLDYNIQDTLLLHKLDAKLQFIELANTLAHSNCATMQQTMGTVALTDQAIMIEAHQNGLVVHNKRRAAEGEMRAAGGWVQEPKKGLHHWVGSTDLNSLYPSAIRALNMSNETIIGQVRTNRTNAAINTFIEAAKPNTFAGWWNDRFNTLEMQPFFDDDNYEKIYLDMEDGETYELTGSDLRKIMFDGKNDWCISANGTIFRNDKPGIIPSLLTRWYRERKEMQAHAKSYVSLKDSEGIDIPDGYFADADIDDSVDAADPFGSSAFLKATLNKFVGEEDYDGLKHYMNQHRLTVKDGKVIARDQKQNNEYFNFWDKRQLVKKINLNSLYGGLLNEHSRFYDQRIGQSTTLTGRCITRHMAAQANAIIAGEYDHCGESIIYGDTDSVYFSAYTSLKDQIDSGEIEWTKESVSNLYDKISEMVNETFPDFMQKSFNCPPSYSNGVIAAGREIVASSALYIVKKRYAALVYDDEGERKDVNGKDGKLKAMGLDLRRSDTPVRVQNFLSKILLEVLTGKGEAHVINSVREFKEEFEALRPWDKGMPKAVNNLTKYRGLLDEYMRQLKRFAKKPAKPKIPGHVQASMNWNNLREKNHDFHTTSIVDGQKVIVCYLKETHSNAMTSIAYPVDETHIPEWFAELPFDEELMMEKVVNKKVENLLRVLKWDLSRTSKEAAHLESLFDFGF